VLSCPLAGGCGAGDVLFTGPTNPSSATGAIALPAAGAYGDRLFVATGNWSVSNLSGGLYSVPRAGGAATPLVSGLYPLSSVVFDQGGGLLYYAEQLPGSPQTGVVYSVHPDGTGLTQKAQTAHVLAPLAIDGADLYYADPSIPQVAQCPLGTIVCQGLAKIAPIAMYSDGPSLWITASNGATGTIYRCPTDSLCQGASATFLAGTGQPAGIVSDGTNVYWADAAARGVVTCPVSGCVQGAPRLVGAVADGPTAVAVDASAVYWTDSAGVRKVAR
ncbi:MAG: hypothetical protein ACRELB_25915, partial [Polyangiaceae bacterium]